METGIRYFESQRFISSIWLAASMCVAFVVGELVLIYCYLSDFNMPWYAMIIVTLVFVLLTSIVLFLKYSVTVTDSEVRIKTIGVRVISRDTIEKTEVQDIHAIHQYGGWGIRYWRKGTIGYIFPGAEKGVMIFMKNGNRIMLSSRKSEDLYGALQD